MTYQNYISIDPNIRFGKPCIKGTRISVFDVLGWMGSGMTKEEVIKDYPEITEDALHACLVYAATKERQLEVA